VFKIKKGEGLTYAATSKRFGVGMRTLFKWKKEIEPKKGRNKPATRLSMEALRADVEKYPDKYQYERGKMLGVTVSTIFYGLKRLGISYKKNAESSEGGRSGTYQVPDQDDSV
jgi:transposase